MFVVAGEKPQPPALSDNPDILAVQHEGSPAPFHLTYNFLILHKFFFFFFKFSSWWISTSLNRQIVLPLQTDSPK